MTRLRSTSRGPVAGLPHPGRKKLVVRGWVDGQGGRDVCRLRVVGEDDGAGGVDK